jgi:transmembrane sensor
MSDEPLSLASLQAMTPTQAATQLMACEVRDESLLARWLSENEANQAAWQHAQLVWSLFDVAEEDPMIASMARAARLAGPDIESFPVAEPANDRTWAKALAAAVAVFLIATTTVMGLYGHWFSSEPSTAVASDDRGDQLAHFGKPDYLSDRRENLVVDLPDGTRVTLAPQSALDLAFANGRRNMRLLRGRGYFDVVHDSSRPFEVGVSGRVVTALGTRFDVSLTPQRVRVVLAEGSVSIMSAPGSRTSEDRIMLKPGQAFTADRDKPGAVRMTDVDNDLSWHENFEAFDNRPLSEVVDRLNRSTRAQIFIRNPKIAALHVSGQFRTGNIERFGRALSLVLPVRLVARSSDRYEIIYKR